MSNLPFSSVQVIQARPEAPGPEPSTCATRRNVAPGIAMPCIVRTTPVAGAEAFGASCAPSEMLKTTSAPAKHIRCGAKFLAYTPVLPFCPEAPRGSLSLVPHSPDRELRAAGLFNAYLDVVRPNRVTFV